MSQDPNVNDYMMEVKCEDILTLNKCCSEEDLKSKLANNFLAMECSRCTIKYNGDSFPCSDCAALRQKMWRALDTK